VPPPGPIGKRALHLADQPARNHGGAQRLRVRQPGFVGAHCPAVEPHRNGGRVRAARLVAQLHACVAPRLLRRAQCQFARQHAPRAVHLVEVLPRPGAAADRHRRSVGIDHEFLSGRAVVAVGPARDEHAGAVQRDLGHLLAGAGARDRFLGDAPQRQPVRAHVMVQRDRHALRLPLAPVGAHLREHLAVGPDLSRAALRPEPEQLAADPVGEPVRRRQLVRRGHRVRIAHADRLVVAEVALLALAGLEFAKAQRGVDAQALGVRTPEVACGVLAVAGLGIAAAHQRRDVERIEHRAVRGDASGDEDAIEHAGDLHAALAERVAAHHVFDDRVGGGIAELVGMPGQHELGGLGPGRVGVAGSDGCLDGRSHVGVLLDVDVSLWMSMRLPIPARFRPAGAAPARRSLRRSGRCPRA